MGLSKIGGFPKNGWLLRETPSINGSELGVPLLETSMNIRDDHILGDFLARFNYWRRIWDSRSRLVLKRHNISKTK